MKASHLLNHPAALLIQKLQLTETSAKSFDWRFIYCVLKLLADSDPRNSRPEYLTLCDDVFNRIMEAGVEFDTPALRLIVEKLNDVREQELSGRF